MKSECSASTGLPEVRATSMDCNGNQIAADLQAKLGPGRPGRALGGQHLPALAPGLQPGKAAHEHIVLQGAGNEAGCLRPLPCHLHPSDNIIANKTNVWLLFYFSQFV